MSLIQSIIDIQPIIIHLGPLSQKMNDHEFFEFCQLNKDFRIERTSEGDLIIMPSAGGKTGRINFALNTLFGQWADKDGSGIGFDSSTGFTLPNGAKRSPDLSWVKLFRWESLTEEEKEEFPPLCPDFVVEIRSRSDSLISLQDKMQEYIDNGTQLGWLIDPIEKNVYIYRPPTSVCCLKNPKVISGDPIMPGLTLELGHVW